MTVLVTDITTIILAKEVMFSPVFVPFVHCLSVNPFIANPVKALHFAILV